MLISQLAALTELPEQPQIVSCSALLLFSAKPFAYPLQLVHVVDRDLFLQRRILNHGSVNQNSPILFDSFINALFMKLGIGSSASDQSGLCVDRKNLTAFQISHFFNASFAPVFISRCISAPAPYPKFFLGIDGFTSITAIRPE